jgi:hypothetical protein
VALDVARMARGMTVMASGAAPNAVDAPPKSPHPTTTHRAINALATPMPGRAAALPRHPILPEALAA